MTVLLKPHPRRRPLPSHPHDHNSVSLVGIARLKHFFAKMLLSASFQENDDLVVVMHLSGMNSSSTSPNSPMRESCDPLLAPEPARATHTPPWPGSPQ
jgi:hypothetical protein